MIHAHRLDLWIGWRFIDWRMVPGRSPLAGGTFAFPQEHRLDNKLILGSLLFGIGWGLIGLCPGPAIASLSYGGWTGAVFFIAMLVGMLIAPFMCDVWTKCMLAPK